MSKKALIAIGVMGLIYGGPALAASSLICAAYVYCSNSTHCDMTGDMADKMYLADVLVQNGTKELPFKSAQSENGESQCYYGNNNLNWPSHVTFFSDASVKIYPQPGNDTDWMVNKEDEYGSCFNDKGGNSSSTKCPFSTTPFFKL